MQAHSPRTPWMDDAEESGHVLKALRGDRRAFLSLLRHYHRPVYRLAFALTREVGAAVAVTLAAALKAKEGVRFMAEGSLFLPWIAGVVRSRVRSRRRPDASLVPPMRGPRVAPGVVELAERLLKAFDDLEPDEQTALVLRIVEQLPYAAIETVLQVTPGSARALLTQARARLTAQMRAAGGDGETHLTIDQLSAQLDGVLEGASFDLIRHHLEGCEDCRLQCLRMASADDVLRALLVHDPEASFFDALAAFLEDECSAKEAAGWIPPELERAIAAETARLDEERWGAVSQAVPRPFVLPASAVRPLEAPEPAGATAAPDDATRAPASAPSPKPASSAGTVAPATAPSPKPTAGDATRAPATAPSPKPAAVVASPAPEPLPHRAATPAAPRTAPPVRRDGATLLVGAALAVVVLLLAGFYLDRWGLRSRLGHFRAPAAARPAASIAARPAPALPPWISRSEGSAQPNASDSAATISDLPAEKRPPVTAPAGKLAVEKVAVAPEGVPAVVKAPAIAKAPATVKAPAAQPAGPAARSAERSTAQRRAADDLGILCGRVRDESGLPVVRAQVLFADLQLGALTDRNGRFCLSAPIGSRTVSVIALGFATQRRLVTVGSRTPELAVTLRSAAVRESSRVESR